jgi:hypothetical protein
MPTRTTVNDVSYAVLRINNATKAVPFGHGWMQARRSSGLYILEMLVRGNDDRLTWRPITTRKGAAMVAYLDAYLDGFRHGRAPVDHPVTA